MKASLLLVASLTVTVLSIASANPDWRNMSTSSPERCNVGSWPVLSATCRNLGKYKTYAECVETNHFLAWRPMEYHWYCTSLAFNT